MKKQLSELSPREHYEALDIIRGCMESCCTEKESEELFEKGFVDNADMFMSLLQNYADKLKHHCTTRCLIPVRNNNTDEQIMERKCKSPNHRIMNPNPIKHKILSVFP